jgi:hypothetical protein
MSITWVNPDTPIMATVGSRGSGQSGQRVTVPGIACVALRGGCDGRQTAPSVDSGRRHRHTDAVNRFLVVLGILILAVGLAWPVLSKLPLFRLPGDILIERPGFKAYFPITTMLVISAVASLVVWLMRR